MGNVYHYTNLGVLALILYNKKVRFNNLCKVDDFQEKYVSNKMFNTNEINLGRFCYVSCWTKNSNESISMWNMYGDRKEGVRIAVPEDMFDKNYSVFKEYNKKGINTKKLVDIKDKIIVPETVKIEYNRKNHPDLLNDNYEISLDALGKYKNKGWGFQREYRFRLFACKNMNSQENIFFTSEDDYKEYFSEYSHPIEEEYVDFSLNKNAVSKMKILIGPNMSKDKIILLKSLLVKYGLNDNKVGFSCFTEKREDKMSFYQSI